MSDEAVALRQICEMSHDSPFGEISSGFPNLRPTAKCLGSYLSTHVSFGEYRHDIPMQNLFN